MKGWKPVCLTSIQILLWEHRLMEMEKFLSIEAQNLELRQNLLR